MVSTIKHGCSVTDVQLMSTKSQDKRYLALIDSNMNIFIVHVGNGDGSKSYKLGKRKPSKKKKILLFPV